MHFNYFTESSALVDLPVNVENVFPQTQVQLTQIYHCFRKLMEGGENGDHVHRKREKKREKNHSIYKIKITYT